MQVSCSVNSYDRPQYWCHPNLQMITVDIKTDVSICVKVAVVWASSAESAAVAHFMQEIKMIAVV